MTTEVEAAISYGPRFDVLDTSLPYAKGRRARQEERAFLNNPYGHQTIQWQDWRTGWLAQDMDTEGEQFHRRVA